VADVGEPEGGANEKSWPVPLSARVWGLPKALSARVIAPVLAPPAVGVNVTLTLQFAPAATAVPTAQVVPLAARLKSPVAAIEVKFKA